MENNCDHSTCDRCGEEFYCFCLSEYKRETDRLILCTECSRELDTIFDEIIKNM